jgi:hypothetical protein
LHAIALGIGEVDIPACMSLFAMAGDQAMESLPIGTARYD